MSRSVALLSAGLFALPGLAQAAAFCDATPDTLSDCLSQAMVEAELEIHLGAGIYEDIAWNDAATGSRVYLKGDPANPASVVVQGLVVSGQAATVQLESVVFERVGAPMEVQAGSLGLTNVTFASLDGTWDGAYLMASDGADLTVSQSRFHELEAREAVLLVEDSDCTLDHTYFGHNLVDYGSVITAVDSNLVVHASEFQENQSSLDGGSINVSGGVLEVDATVFHGGETGGYGGHVSVIDASTVVVDNVEFQGGDAMQGGGALRLDGVEHAFVTGCLFTGNEGRRGGALLMAGSTSLEARDLEFQGNTALVGGHLMVEGGSLDLARSWMVDGGAHRGAAMAMSGGEVFARNVAFYHQRQAQQGGAVFMRAGVLDLRYAVMVANPASSGAGLYMDGGDAQLTGVILDQDRHSPVIENESNGQVDIYDSIVRGSVVGNVSGSVLSDDPMFTDVMHADLHLLPDSPARDAVTTGDLDLDGTVADMGVYGGPDCWGF